MTPRNELQREIVDCLDEALRLQSSREWHTPTMAKCPKRPRHPNQLAKLIVHVALGEQPNDSPRPGPPTPGTEARRKGGLKGGKVRAKTLSEAKRKAIARKTARERWGQG